MHREHGKGSPEYSRAVLEFNADITALKLKYNVESELIGRTPYLRGVDY